MTALPEDGARANELLPELEQINAKHFGGVEPLIEDLDADDEGEEMDCAFDPNIPLRDISAVADEFKVVSAEHATAPEAEGENAKPTTCSNKQAAGMFAKIEATKKKGRDQQKSGVRQTRQASRRHSKEQHREKRTKQMGTQAALKPTGLGALDGGLAVAA